MRKNVRIVGVGPRMAGIGKKSGKAYDFQNVSIAFPSDGFNGEEACTVSVPGEVLNCTPALVPGMSCTVVMHQANYRWQLDDILEVE